MSIILNDGADIQIWKDVEAEILRADTLHPGDMRSSNDLRRAAIMAEEAGEALAAGLDYTRPGANDLARHKAEQELYHETVQTVASGLRILRNMIREGRRPDNGGR